MPLRERYLVRDKLMDALYGPILLCQDRCRANQLVAIKLVSLNQQKQLQQATSVLTDNPLQEKYVAEFLGSTEGHVNVLQYHQIAHEDQASTLVFVMEFCDGGDLQQALHRTPESRFDEAQALKMFSQIVAGVGFLHTVGLAHRDLSLENVLLTSEGICKVCDFGLCVKTTQVCVGKVGKDFYMAPEVVAGQFYDPVRADIWSLGVLLFVLLTGSPLWRLAHETEVTFDLVQKSGIQTLLMLWRMDRLLSLETIDLLRCMLQVHPRDRLTLKEIAQHRALAHSKPTAS